MTLRVDETHIKFYIQVFLQLQIGSTFLSSTLFIKAWKTDGALARPYSITRYSVEVISDSNKGCLSLISFLYADVVISTVSNLVNMLALHTCSRPTTMALLSLLQFLLF